MGVASRAAPALRSGCRVCRRRHKTCQSIINICTQADQFCEPVPVARERIGKRSGVVVNDPGRKARNDRVRTLGPRYVIGRAQCR